MYQQSMGPYDPYTPYTDDGWGYAPYAFPPYYDYSQRAEQVPQQAPQQQQIPQTFPPAGTQVGQQQPQQQVQPDGMLPLEVSFIENILRFNRGKRARFYMTFENNPEWPARVFSGIVEEAGRDHIIVSSPEDGQNYLLLMVNLDYVEFDDEIEYIPPEVPEFVVGAQQRSTQDETTQNHQ